MASRSQFEITIDVYNRFYDENYHREEFNWDLQKEIGNSHVLILGRMRILWFTMEYIDFHSII